jgi:hypothetical protein
MNDSFRSLAEGWRVLRGLRPLTMEALAIPVALALLLLVGATLLWVSPNRFTPPATWMVVVVLLFTTSFHELAHVLCTPHIGLSEQTIIGVWPERLMMYTHYEGPLSRGRYLLILLGPLTALSGLPLTLIALLNPVWPGSPVLAALAWLAWLNSAISCVDVIMALRVLRHIPSGAIIREQGWTLYWKPTARTS